MAQPALPDPAPAADHDNVVVLRGLTWADYERILTIRGDAPVPRLAFLQGALELMTPSKAHESRKSIIGCLVEAWCFENDVDISPFGSWTLKDPGVERGVEPDECYIVGDRDAERPDLAIEVIHTSGGIDKLDAYRLLGVRELWFHEGGTFQLFALRGDRYDVVTASEVLPGIDLELLGSFLPVRPMTRAVRAFRQALRERSRA
ncbi:MAG TPA: Uma2 family endonuclease [Polyangiaceae bacterium]|nr:Uma2 family endonuclease [Polyangiaceae bacterium]